MDTCDESRLRDDASKSLDGGSLLNFGSVTLCSIEICDVAENFNVKMKMICGCKKVLVRGSEAHCDAPLIQTLPYLQGQLNECRSHLNLDGVDTLNFDCITYSQKDQSIINSLLCYSASVLGGSW